VKWETRPDDQRYVTRQRDLPRRSPPGEWPAFTRAGHQSQQGTAMLNRPFVLNFLVLGLLVVTLAACGDTWEGLKQDTGENVEATGRAIEKVGEAVRQ
jgi:hypothetical protein